MKKNEIVLKGTTESNENVRIFKEIKMIAEVKYHNLQVNLISWKKYLRVSPAHLQYLIFLEVVRHGFRFVISHWKVSGIFFCTYFVACTQDSEYILILVGWLYKRKKNDIEKSILGGEIRNDACPGLPRLWKNHAISGTKKSIRLSTEEGPPSCHCRLVYFSSRA